MGYRLQPILDLASACAKLGVRHAVLSPGSRVAPLTLAFTRQPGIKAYTIPDERAAAYMALGMAQASHSLVALACTSGTAVLNYAPAIAEAFYQQVPLLVLTADRPAEWVDQQDGQTIRQQGVHALHCKACYQLPADYVHPDALWAISRIISEAASLATAFPCGPVHVNVPIREPFYPTEEAQPQEHAPVVADIRGEMRLSESQLAVFRRHWQEAERPLIVPGQGQGDAAQMALAGLYAPVLAEPIANMAGLPNGIALHDSVLMKASEALAPDLLVTFGNSIVSKALKLFLRKHRPSKHIHIQEAGTVADPFQSLTHIARTSPALFFASLPSVQAHGSYLQDWKAREATALSEQGKFFQQQSFFGEFAAVRALLHSLPTDVSVNLHLANSMAVRLASFVGVSKHGVQVWANRGTSGIDGCNSTAVGHALANPSAMHILITGDMAFLYDRNAFWHQYALPNLRILLINNHGGGIFRMIPGPNKLPETDAFFVTEQRLTAQHLSEELGISRKTAQTRGGYEQALSWLLDAGAKEPRLLEFFTDSKKDAGIWEAYKKAMGD